MPLVSYLTNRREAAFLQHSLTHSHLPQFRSEPTQDFSLGPFEGQVQECQMGLNEFSFRGDDGPLREEEVSQSVSHRS